MDFKNVSKKYRPVPFWSWNEKLNCEETSQQVSMMDAVGLGGYFMHARGGLQTEYMGDEWFENIRAAVDTGKKLGMHSWAYDENGWPSGFGSGKVNALGIEYQQKYLRISEVKPEKNIICKSGEHWFYFDVNPYYVDVLDKEVIAEFIKSTYVPNYEKFGKEIEGFFTDEPQISRNGIPWSFVLEDEYKKRYNDDLLMHLEELFLPKGDYQTTRIKFWKMVTSLFSEAYFKQIYEQCEEWGVKLTGHLLLEESLENQLISNGACMPHYEYMHIPGMDWLGRNIRECLTPMQVASVCEQLGKKQVLSETFAACGHNVSFAQLKGIYEWQMVHGINLLCQHLEGYSLRGLRKRDWPPAMGYQQPWWSEYSKFNDAMSRVGMLLSEGKKEVEILVLHPMTTAWTMYDDKNNTGIKELDKKLLSVIKELEEKHIIYHLGDEMIMEKYAYVENGSLVIGTQKYNTIVDPGCEVLLEKTQKLIDEFKACGGRVIRACEIPENNITDNKEITYTKRIFDDFNVHYFVNSSNNRKKAKINVNGKKLDIYSGDLLEFNGYHEFEEWGSLVIIEDGSSNMENNNTNITIVHPENKFKVIGPTRNLLMLDSCDYFFDGELQEKNGYVLNICERANALKKSVNIHQDYRVKILHMPEKIEMACETPEQFTIIVNGIEIEKDINGWIIDKSFKTIDITKYLRTGENVISFECDFKQNDSTYECFEKAKHCETEKNKLVYDMEIEAIYLIGDFSVKTDGVWENLEKNAVRYTGGFEIERPTEYISSNHIERQGYPFFCGTLDLEGEVNIYGENPVLELDMAGINVVSVEINGIKKTVLTDKRILLSDFGVTGKTQMKLSVTNNLRNLLGPHHLENGESYFVSPGAFYKENCVWSEEDVKWNDGYCFAEMSI